MASELDDQPVVLVVVEGAAHLVRTEDDAAELIVVGDLRGGIYCERFTSEERDYQIHATFDHERLPGQ